MFTFLKNLATTTWQNITRWFWIFFGYFLSQVGIQAMNLIAGFIIIRAMTKDSYADYTIINTLAPVMLMLSDNGIGTGISAIGRRIWQDDEKMGRLVNTGLQLRRQFALIGFILIGPLLAWMLFRNHAAILTIALLILITLTGISFQLTTAVMRAVLQFRQQLKVLAHAGLISALFRLALIASFAAFLHLNAVLATLMGTGAVIVEAYFLVRAVKSQVHWNAAPDSDYRTTIFSLVKKTAPLTIYFCFQSQISIWLISIFGSAHQVADIGAAGRLGVIFATLTGSCSGIMVPRFARNNGRHRLFIQFWQIVLSLTTMLLLFVAFAKLFPSPFILLLGAKYTNMSGLIWLVVLSSGVNTMAGLIFGLNIVKGWVPPAILTIPVEIITQIVLLLSLNLSVTENVLIFSCVAPIPPIIVTTILLLRRIHIEEE